MSLTRLWAWLAVVLPVVAALAATLSAVDLAYHLRAGEGILSGGGVPRVDTFTFTAVGREWIDQQWGAQVVLAAAYRLAGWTGLVILRAALVGLLFGLLLLACRLRGADLRTAAWLTLAAFIIAAPALALRPQLLGMVLLGVTLVLVAARRTRPRLLYLVPLVVVAWANVHGSFFLGPVVVGLAWLEDVHERSPLANRTFVVAVVAAVAALVNPFGPAVWTYAVGLSVNPEVTTRITEWQRTSLGSVAGILFYASVLGVVLILARRGRSVGWPTYVWLAIYFAIGAYAIRGVAWWPLGAAFAVAALVASRGPAVDRPTPTMALRLNTAIVTAVIIVGIVLLPVWRATDPGTGAPRGVLTDAPGGITAALRATVQPGDRLLNPQTWGSWFEFAIPEATVALDSRIELFPTEVWDDYDTVQRGGQDWQGILARWAPTYVVATKGDDAFVERLEGAGWTVVFADDREGSILAAP